MRYLAFCLLALAWLGLAPPLRADDPLSTIEDWRSQLLSDDVEVRRRVAIKTRSADRPLQKRLLADMVERLTVDHDGQVRLAIMDTLTDMGPDAQGAIEVLAASMRKNFGGRYNEEIHQDFRAALALAAIGASAVPELRTLLESEERTNVRAEAIMALGRIGGPSKPSVKDLIGLLADEEDRLRREAIVALGRIGDAAREPLLVAARSDAEVVRAGAIEALGAVGVSSPGDVDIIITATNDEKSLVRTAAIGSLSKLDIPDDKRKMILVAGLADSEPSVRLAVVNTLADDRKTLRSIERELVELLTADDDGVAWHAAFLLQRRGHDAAAVLLEVATDDDCRVRQLGRALSLIGSPITPELFAAMEHPHPRVRRAAALALGEIRPIQADTATLLARGLDDEDASVQLACLESIGRLGSSGRDALAAVRVKLDHDSAQMRTTAIDVVARIAPRDPTLIEDLIKMAGDHDPSVQCRAIEAITATGPIGRKAIPIVVNRLRSADEDVRLAAATMIGSHGSGAGEALPALTQLLADSDHQWRLKILETISRLGAAAKPAVAELALLLDDPSEEIRESALDAIGDLGLPPEQLTPWVSKGLHDRYAEVRGRAMRITRQLGPAAMELVPTLISLAAKEEDQRSVNRVLERLQRYPVPAESISELRNLAAHKVNEVQLLAVRFLGLAGPAAADSVPMLRELLKKGDEAVQAEASVAIDKIQASDLEAKVDP